MPISLAFVRAYGTDFLKYTVARAAQGQQKRLNDIRVLDIPMRLAEFSSVFAAGFLAQIYGYTPPF